MHDFDAFHSTLLFAVGGATCVCGPFETRLSRNRLRRVSGGAVP